MSKQILEKNIDLGTGVFFLIIPFSTSQTTLIDYSCKQIAEWYKFGEEVFKEDYSPNKNPDKEEGSLLNQLRDKDKEIYSEHQFRDKYLTRGLFYEKKYKNDILFGIRLKILLTHHSDGNGTLVLINLLPSMTIEKYFEVIDELIEKWENQALINDVPCTVIELVKKVFYNCSQRKHLPSISWGEPFPFFTIGASEKNIDDLKVFKENNKAFIYALLHQDYKFGGWERIREEKLDKLIGEDLSRRNEYALFLTDMAMLEIDSDSRKNFISEWAEKKHTSEENMRIKLLFERVQLLELLLMQQFILLAIDNDIQHYEVSAKTPVNQLVNLNNRITSALSKYYYANAMARQHVSGTEWVAYGQGRFHLEELIKLINNRIELIESTQQIKSDFTTMKGNFMFQLISVLLGSSAILSFFDFVTLLPCFAESWFANHIIWLKFFIYVLFIVVLIVFTIRHLKDR